MNTPASNFYDPVNARLLVGFAAAAYASDVADASDFSDMIEDAGTDTRAVIFRPTEQDMVVAFRGTRSLQNFVTDLQARRVPLLDGPAGAEVHQGFQNAFNSVRRVLGNFLRSNGPTRRVWLTGHSLGGALAKLAAARFFREHTLADVYTFGEPRVGNAAFRDYYDYWLRAKTFRVVDGADFIIRTQTQCATPFTYALLYVNTNVPNGQPQDEPFETIWAGCTGGPTNFIDVAAYTVAADNVGNYIFSNVYIAVLNQPGNPNVWSFPDITTFANTLISIGYAANFVTGYAPTICSGAEPEYP